MISNRISGVALATALVSGILGSGSTQAQEFQSAAAASRPAPAFLGSTAPSSSSFAGTQEFPSATAPSRSAPAFAGSTASSGVDYAGTQEFLAAAAASRPGSATSVPDHTPDTRYAQMSRVPAHPAPNARLMARIPAGAPSAVNAKVTVQTGTVQALNAHSRG